MHVLYILLAACAVMGLAVLWLNHRVLGRYPTIPQFETYLERDPVRYKSMRRLLRPDDYRFVAEARGGRLLLSRLRRERRRLLRLVLHELRVEFEALMAVGALLCFSSSAKEEQFPALLWRQSVRFYVLHTALLAISFMPGPWPPPLDLFSLLDKLKWLRDSTQRIMNSLTPGDLEELRVGMHVE